MLPRMSTPPEPPRIPLGAHMKYDGSDLVVSLGFRNKWRVPLSGAVIETLDRTGQRISLTRIATLGVLGLGSRKKTGQVTVIVLAPNGESRQVRVEAPNAEYVLTWAIRFNAWRTAVHGG
jgi:hypothetical protein